MKAHIIVDIQNDFMTGGNLAVPGGEDIVGLVNSLQGRFELVVATQDWHPPDHKSFASNHAEKKPFDKIMLGGLPQVLWPDHCVQGTPGAAFHPALELNHVECIFRKGMDPMIDSYSGFFDNGRKKSTGLAGYLKERMVEKVYVCGLAADYCVYYTAKDALQSGFTTYFIEDATRPIDQQGYDEAKRDLLKLNGNIVRSAHLL